MAGQPWLRQVPVRRGGARQGMAGKAGLALSFRVQDPETLFRGGGFEFTTVTV